MNDSAETASFEAVPADDGQPVSASAEATWSADPPAAAPPAAAVSAEHPEVLVGAAFVGGLALATILKRLAR